MPMPRETALGPRPIARGGKGMIVPDRWFFAQAGTQTFTAQVSGTYTFYGWSGGAMGGGAYSGSPVAGGAAGNFARRTVQLAKDQQVPFIVGLGSTKFTGISGSWTAPQATTINFADLTVTIPAPASVQASAPGARPTGGDINLIGGRGGLPGSYVADAGEGAFAGAPGAASFEGGGGGSAPGDAILRGGPGSNAILSTSDMYANKGGFPGGGAGSVYSNSTREMMGFGGDGLVIVIFGGPRA